MKLLTVTQVTDNYGATTSFSNTIRTSDIRCFYPRHDNKQGTRITFRDGGGFAVLDEYAALQEALVGQPERFVPVTQIKERYGSGHEEISTVINGEAVRCFYPRRNEEAGTRLTFDDGGGFAIKEPFDYVLQALSDGTDHRVMPEVSQREPLQLVHSANAVDGSEWEDDEEEDPDWNT